MENKQSSSLEPAEYEILEVIRERDREFNHITESEKIVYLIKEYIGDKSAFLKNSFPPVSFKIVSYEDNGDVFLSCDQMVSLEGDFVLYVPFKKQIELNCTFLEKSGDKIKAAIQNALIAKEGRKTKRVLTEGHEVFGHRFLISKNKIDLNPMSFSVSNRVIFSDVERSIGVKYPGLKILDMDPMNDSMEKKLLKKYGKGWIVENVHDPEAYAPSSPELLNLASTPEFDVQKSIQRFKTGGTKSWICRPLNYTNVAGQSFPIGYMVIKSTEKEYSLEDYNNLEAEETRIIERIKDANTVLVDVKEKILNVGANGSLLEIKDAELQDYLLNRTDLTLDLLFKYQAGLRFYAQIAHVKRKRNNALLVGLAFHGVVYSGVSGEKNKKILQDSLSYLVKQGASVA